MSISVLGKSKMEIDSIVTAGAPPPSAACLGGTTQGRGGGFCWGSWFVTPWVFSVRPDQLSSKAISPFLVPPPCHIWIQKSRPQKFRPQSGHIYLQNPPTFFPPQGVCTGSFCLELWHLMSWLSSSLTSLSKCHLLRGPFPDPQLKINPFCCSVMGITSMRVTGEKQGA